MKVVYMKRKIKVLSLIWSMGAGGAQQVLINYLRDFQNDDDIEFKVCVFTKPTTSKYDKEIKEKGYYVEYMNDPQSIVKIPYIKRWFNTIPENRRVDFVSYLDKCCEFVPCVDNLIYELVVHPHYKL